MNNTSTAILLASCYLALSKDEILAAEPAKLGTIAEIDFYQFPDPGNGATDLPMVMVHDEFCALSTLPDFEVAEQFNEWIQTSGEMPDLQAFAAKMLDPEQMNTMLVNISTGEILGDGETGEGDTTTTTNNIDQLDDDDRVKPTP